MRGSGVDYDASSEGHTWPSGGAGSERNRKEDFSWLYEVRARDDERCESREIVAVNELRAS